MKRFARKVVNWLYFGVWSACPHDWMPAGSVDWWCQRCGAER